MNKRMKKNQKQKYQQEKQILCDEKNEDGF